MSSPELASKTAPYAVAVHIVLIVASLMWLFGAGLLEHLRYTQDLWHFNDDVRQQVWPLLRYADAQLFRGDYIADYYLANLPPGYRLLYAPTAGLVDPRLLSKVLPSAQLLVVVTALVIAAWSLAGPAAAWGTGVLSLSTTLFMARLGGGLPRSFAFPLVALTVVALVRGKTRGLCLLTVLGAAFYYPMGIMIGVVTALHLIVVPRRWQGDSRDWFLRRRILVLSVTAAAAGLFAIPSQVAVRPYGPRLGYHDVMTYPEAGPGGRYGEADLPLAGTFLRTVEADVAAALPSGTERDDNEIARGWLAASDPGLVGCALLLVAGFAAMLMTDVRSRRLLPLVVAPCLLYPVALALWPRFYLPTRYVTYVVPVLVVVVLPAALASLIRCLRSLRTSRLGSAAVLMGVIVLVLPRLGGADLANVGTEVFIPEAERPLYDFLARLPPDATIAGWPRGPIENVPYLSRRKILHGFEVHQALHKGYVEEMRRRMDALIDAYFAPDLAPLLRLRRELGVTHLLVNRAHYYDPGLSYFAPFQERIAIARRAAGGRWETLHQASAAGVFHEGSLIVLDLDRITDREVR